MPQNAFFSTNSRSSGPPQNDAETLFSTLHPLSPVIFATATVVAFVLLRNSRFNFPCYTQRQATPTQKSARKWRYDLSRLLVRKITKGIHSCKLASLNRPIGRWFQWPQHTYNYKWGQYLPEKSLSAFWTTDSCALTSSLKFVPGC